MATIHKVVTYHPQCAWSRVVSTWTTAIDSGNFCTWPGLSSAAVRKHLDKSIGTAKGHMKQTRKGLRSTKIVPHDFSAEMTTASKTRT